jgi:nitrile hydratase subunit beta
MRWRRVSYLSHADLGGRLLEEPVAPEPEGAPFHARWQGRVHALTLAMGASGAWNLDMSRAARETLPDYDERSYYGRWLGGLERLLLARGLVTADEIAAGRALHPARPVSRVLVADEVMPLLGRGAPTERPASTPARFAVGQRVRLRRDAAPHHTRLPGYARGKCRVIERIRGAHVFADAHAQGLGEQPEWLYTVAFAEEELWGQRAPRQVLSVAIDAWEPYLERA